MCVCVCVCNLPASASVQLDHIGKETRAQRESARACEGDKRERNRGIAESIRHKGYLCICSHKCTVNVNRIYFSCEYFSAVLCSSCFRVFVRVCVYEFVCVFEWLSLIVPRCCCAFSHSLFSLSLQDLSIRRIQRFFKCVPHLSRAHASVTTADFGPRRCIEGSAENAAAELTHASITAVLRIFPYMKKKQKSSLCQTPSYVKYNKSFI